MFSSDDSKLSLYFSGTQQLFPIMQHWQPPCLIIHVIWLVHADSFKCLSSCNSLIVSLITPGRSALNSEPSEDTGTMAAGDTADRKKTLNGWLPWQRLHLCGRIFWISKMETVGWSDANPPPPWHGSADEVNNRTTSDITGDAGVSIYIVCSCCSCWVWTGFVGLPLRVCGGELGLHGDDRTAALFRTFEWRAADLSTDSLFNCLTAAFSCWFTVEQHLNTDLSVYLWTAEWWSRMVKLRTRLFSFNF